MLNKSKNEGHTIWLMLGVYVDLNRVNVTEVTFKRGAHLLERVDHIQIEEGVK